MKFYRRIAAAAKFAAGHYPMQRTFDVLPDDCFLASYPRSGNTWLRFLVSNMRYQHESPTTFENLNDRIPYALRPDAATMSRLPRPRILKTHSAYDHRFRKVVLLVRDPRDVVISYYHYHVRREKVSASCSIEAYIAKCVGGEMDSYGTWGEHTGSWLGGRAHTAAFLVVKYEDLKVDTALELKRICQFLGLPCDDESLQRAVQGSGPETMKPRKASPGEWREVLPGSSIQLIERNWGHVMQQLGYGLSGDVDRDDASPWNRRIAG